MTELELGRILVVDDEVELMTTLCEQLVKRGYMALGFPSGKEALQILQEESFDLLLTDLMMPEMDGLELLRECLHLDPQTVVIMMTGQATVSTAVESMQSGAFDYILKPFKMKTLLSVLNRGLQVGRLRSENLALRDTVVIYELSQTIAFTRDTKTILNQVADGAL